MSSETCNSKVELEMLASGMAKQHEQYQDALQELVDNSVSAIVSDETYFSDRDDRIEILISIIRDEDTVRTIVADNGPGIKRAHLREEVFRTGNKEISDGILNNVGWGLKASIAWFEQTLKQEGIDNADHWFDLITQTTGSDLIQVSGPITGDLPLTEGSPTKWTEGVDLEPLTVPELDYGTRVQVSCSRTQFDTDVWPAAASLEKKAQTLREEFGVKFRELLDARDDNQIYIYYHDRESGESDLLEVVPLFPEYADEKETDEEFGHDEFSIDDEDGNTFTIEYERGTLDYESMQDEVRDEHPGLLTSSGRFRTRYRPSQKNQGVDIYANGRVLMTSVFTDLFDLERNNEYNYFGGRVKIVPDDPAVEVPTDNKKTRIDTNSTLWTGLQETLSQEQYQPQGKDYHSKEEASNSSASTSRTGSESESEESTPPESDASSLLIDSEDELYAFHHSDAREIEAIFQQAGLDPTGEGIIDVTITSPPYFDLKNYGYDDEQQVGPGDSYDQYLEQLREIFSQVYSYTADTGMLWVVVNSFKQDNHFVHLPADIANIAQNLPGYDQCTNCSTDELTVPLVLNKKKGRLECENCEFEPDSRANSWRLQEIVVWNKNRALPYSEAGKFRNVFEYILGFSKTEKFTFDLESIRIPDPAQFKGWWVDYPERYHPLGKMPENIWEFTTPSQGAFGELSESLDHPAPFPPKLVERLLNLTTEPGDTVLDPFAGSGMVLAQANAMDRKPIGFEMNEEYIQNYKQLEQDILDSNYKSNAEGQQKLANIIGGLRQIKQARELLREVASRQNIESPAALDIDAVFSIQHGLDPTVMNSQSFIDASLFVVVEESMTPRRAAQLETLLHEVLSADVCSGYGIDITLSVVTPSDVQEIADHDEISRLQEELRVYTEGRHYVYDFETSLEEWRQNAVITNEWQETHREQEPPIVSNVKLEVHNPRRSSEDATQPSNDELVHKVSVSGIDDQMTWVWEPSAESGAD